MIVHDVESIEQALQMLAASPEGVRYSDQYSYIIITTPETLEYQCLSALARDDIAIVVSRGHESEMEGHTAALTRIKRQRVREEKRKIKEWIREHPELAKASAEEMPKIVKRIRRGRND